MLWDLLLWPALAFGLSLGVGWPLASRLKLSPTEQLVAAAGLALLGIFVAGWTIYLCALPTSLCWLMPFFSGTGLLLHRGKIAAGWRDAAARNVIVGQALVTTWCLAWLAWVHNYSGGGWAGDWAEHWERAVFFLHQWPTDTLFTGYPLTARPPLENVVVAVLLRLTREDFAHFQFFSTALASLVFLPAALLAVRFAKNRASAVPILTLLMMLSPLVLENATFAWTKLPAAFFVLGAIAFFLRTHDSDAPDCAGPLTAALLAAGFVTHYSSGPYVVILAGAWLVFGWQQRGDPAWWRRTALSAAAGAAVLALWFAWSFGKFGAAGTLLSNTSVTALDAERGHQTAKVLLNLRDTLVPHFLRPLDPSLIAQASPWGSWRDWWFQLYQINLFFALGSVGWLVAIAGAIRAWPGAPRSAHVFWSGFVIGSVFLGVAVHGARDTWGLAHICLQPLALLALAFVAARWDRLADFWRRIAVAGLAADFVLGIALHFAVQNYAFDRWLTPGRSLTTWTAQYNIAAMMNLQGKLQHQLVFFADLVPFGLPWLALPPLTLLAFALYRLSEVGGSARKFLTGVPNKI